jgi:tRNA (guanine-N7-)-methyltransferase
MEDEIDRVYLNFSDPWPKKRHFKRRLTYRDFLDMYAYILKPQGEIHFKTDNKGLYEFSLNELSDKHWQLKNITFDLHNSNFEGNIMTEYEEKFSSQGKPIYRCEAISPKNRL